MTGLENREFFFYNNEFSKKISKYLAIGKICKIKFASPFEILCAMQVILKSVCPSTIY